MKILFITTGLGMGGAERQVVALADAFVERGHDVCIASLTDEMAVKPDSVAVRVVPLGIQKTARGLLAGYMALRRLIRQWRPDVVHSHMVHANLLSRVVRLSTRMPCLINTAHSTYEGGRMRMLGYRLTHSLAELTTNVSEEAVAAFEAMGAVPRGGMVAIGNGINTRQFAPDPVAGQTLRAREGAVPSIRVLLTVGRLVPEKNHTALLQAFACTKIPADVVLWIVGDGPLAERLQAQARQLGIANRVRFFGLQHNSAAFMNAADIFVLPSSVEGLPLVLLEAMACECVVVATDVGGVGRVLGEYGFLARSDNPDALGNALQLALRLDRAQADALGRQARNRVVTGYSLDAVVNTWLALYARFAAT